MPVNRRFTLVRRPSGVPVHEDFLLTKERTPTLEPGQFLLRNHYVSIDPAQRGWMDDRPSYLPPIALGGPVRASTVGQIVESRSDAFPVGAWAAGVNAVEDFSVGVEGGYNNLVDPEAVPSITNYLSVIGPTGLAAYFGLLAIGQPKAGETVLVTGAAGSVGSLVGQIAKMRGCRTIGVAGGPAKVRRLLDDYGFDAAIDYRGKDGDELLAEIRQAAPNGVDIQFENVGGDILDAGLRAINPKARIVLCGLISEYNSEPRGARNLWELIVQGARMEGVILTHYFHRIGEAVPELMGWVRDGKLRVDEHIEQGIENVLPAMLRLFDGNNDGKMMLRIID
ncbi:NADP-dependent oxidoreductase [Rhodomicrobium sp. R_RK_3]|uniref:NADP-dependent oxidoreductase n=1 Tax=Rhodomicrobium sp. R_RK_3 TaxID=2029567 RepID=UPI000B4B0282|nr:NADP-dependent oxidoreductase [Rhodomicrobium sp. R_RK_3]